MRFDLGMSLDEETMEMSRGAQLKRQAPKVCVFAIILCLAS